MSDNSQIRKDFDAIDTDRDGHITAAELKKSLAGDPKISKENIDVIVQMADDNDDQKITFEEYAKFVR